MMKVLPLQAAAAVVYLIKVGREGNKRILEDM